MPEPAAQLLRKHSPVRARMRLQQTGIRHQLRLPLLHSLTTTLKPCLHASPQKRVSAVQSSAAPDNLDCGAEGMESVQRSAISCCLLWHQHSRLQLCHPIGQSQCSITVETRKGHLVALSFSHEPCL